MGMGPSAGMSTSSMCSGALASKASWSHRSARTLARRGTRGASPPYRSMRSGSPPERRIKIRTRSGARHPTSSASVSVLPGSTQPERGRPR
eukprot:scaffold189165_cov28-Tisochrysis_lutea.AAC.5